jgi:acyl-CoA dehydrogenase
VPFVGALLRLAIFPLGRCFAPPSDALGHRVASLLIAPSATRDRLSAGIHLPRAESDPLGRLEAALEAAIKAEAVEAKIRAAQKSGAIGEESEDPAQSAFAAKLISGEELSLLKRAAQLRDEVIRVDDFPQDLGRSEAIRPAQPQRAAA